MPERYASSRPGIVGLFETLGIAMIAGDLIFSPPDPWAKAVSAGLSLWLLLLVSRRGRSWARIAWTLLAGAGLALTVWVISYTGVDFSFGQWALQIALWACSTLEIALLWSPSTGRWIADREAARRQVAVE